MIDTMFLFASTYNDKTVVGLKSRDSMILLSGQIAICNCLSTEHRRLHAGNMVNSRHVNVKVTHAKLSCARFTRLSSEHALFGCHINSYLMNIDVWNHALNKKACDLRKLI